MGYVSSQEGRCSKRREHNINSKRIPCQVSTFHHTARQSYDCSSFRCPFFLDFAYKVLLMVMISMGFISVKIHVNETNPKPISYLHFTIILPYTHQRCKVTSGGVFKSHLEKSYGHHSRFRHIRGEKSHHSRSQPNVGKYTSFPWILW